MGKASTRAQNRYIAKAYDRINLTVPKGKKDILQAHAEAQGESVNGFINRAIDNQITQDGHKGPLQGCGGPPVGRAASLSSEPEKVGEAGSNTVTAKEE